MTPTVETATGPVATPSLGATLMHEHVFLVDSEVERNFPREAWNGSRDERMAEAVDGLRALKAGGIDTIVDMTVIGLGRQVDTVQEVARQVDLNIVCATGVYLGRGMPDSFTVRDPGARRPGEDALTELFVRDIVEGIGGTDVKAGVLKGYTNELGLTPQVERCLRAVACAHRETGVPINTHSDPMTRSGLVQLDVFEEEGVDLSRVVIGHSGDTTDLDYLREVMDRGAGIASDRFGLYVKERPNLGDRIDVIVTLVGEGYADRITLGHDSHCFADFSDIEGSEFSRQVYPQWVHTHISDDVIPVLVERGVSETHIHQMMVDNPRRIFERQGGY